MDLHPINDQRVSHAHRETHGGGMRFHGDITIGNVITILVLVIGFALSVRKNDLSHFEAALNANQKAMQQVIDRLEEMRRQQIEDHIRLEILEGRGRLR